MAQLKRSDPAGTAAQPARAQGTGPKAAAKRAAAKAVPRPAATPRVSMVTAGGYTVYGSPVQPKYRTARQIADAIAELD